MKKIFKGLSILVASTALCAGVAMATACDGGYNGEYIGHYCYANEYNAPYGIIVKVTVKNNIIEKIENVTNTYGDGKAFSFTYNPVIVDWTKGGPQRDNGGNWLRSEETVTVYNSDWHTVSDADTWNQTKHDNYVNNEAWLLQKYEGKSVADVLAIKVYVKNTGEPYSSDRNDFGELVITDATQGSGRLLLAVQDALKNK